MLSAASADNLGSMKKNVGQCRGIIARRNITQETGNGRAGHATVPLPPGNSLQFARITEDQIAAGFALVELLGA